MITVNDLWVGFQSPGSMDELYSVILEWAHGLQKLHFAACLSLSVGWPDVSTLSLSLSLSAPAWWESKREDSE